MILSDDVIDDDSTDDGTECDGDYVETREGDSESAEDATSEDYCCTEMDVDITLFTGKNQTKCGKVKRSAHIRSRWQNIPTKLTGVTGPPPPPKSKQICPSQHGTVHYR